MIETSRLHWRCCCTGKLASRHSLEQVAGTYRPDIDRLRALDMLAVVAFHAFPGKLAGGVVYRLSIHRAQEGDLIGRALRCDNRPTAIARSCCANAALIGLHFGDYPWHQRL